MSFDHFLESLENVPPELERNFTLITQLDRRTQEIMTKIIDCIKDYRNTRKREERLALRKKSNELFDKLNSFADDKVELASQIYELIEKNINRLISLGQIQTSDGEKVAAIGFDMPLDPYEPKYCICRGVSHGDMIACDNKDCHIEWFHYGCVNLKAAPKGKWYCGQCFSTSRLAKNNRSRSCAR